MQHVLLLESLYTLCTKSGACVGYNQVMSPDSVSCPAQLKLCPERYRCVLNSINEPSVFSESH